MHIHACIALNLIQFHIACIGKTETFSIHILETIHKTICQLIQDHSSQSILKQNYYKLVTTPSIVQNQPYIDLIDLHKSS